MTFKSVDALTMAAEANDMQTPPRRSRRLSRDRRPVDRLTAENHSGFQSILEEQQDFRQVTIAPAAAAALEEHSYINTKKRRRNSIPNNSFTDPTIPRRMVQVTLRPWDIRRHCARLPLMAALPCPFTPPLSQGEVRVRLQECNAVSHVLAATSLVAFIPHEHGSTAPFQEHPSPPVVLPLVFSKNENDTSSLHAVVEQQQQQETVDIPTSNKIKRKAAADPFLKKKAPTRKQKAPTRKQSGNSRFKKRALRPHKQKTPTPRQEAFDTTNMNARLRRFATPNKRLQRMKAPPRGRRTSNTTPSYSQDYPATPRNPTTRDSLTSFQTPSSYGSAFLQTPASDCSSAISLVTLTQEFYNLILESGSNQVDLKQMAQQMDVPLRRLYDIANVLEGAGMVARSTTKGKYCLVFQKGEKSKLQKKLEKQARNEISSLQEQERKVQEYMSHLELLQNDQSDDEMAYVTPRTLAPLQDSNQDSTFLGIATLRGTAVHQSTHHGFALCPPIARDDESTLPQAYLMESQDSMRQLSLLPKPPLMERCCSDFSYNALNRQSSIGSFHAGGGNALFRQSSTGSIGLGRQSSIGSIIGNTIIGPSRLRAQTSIGSFSCHDDVAATTTTGGASTTTGSPCALQGMVISEMPLTTLQYHESFGLLDKTEPPPSIDPKVFPCTAPDYVVPDENAEPFQYPWLKGTPLSQAKFRPKQSSTRLLSNDSRESSRAPVVTMTDLSSGMNESLLPRRSRRSLLDDDDDDEEPMFLTRVSHDMGATLLHQCATSLVLWND